MYRRILIPVDLAHAEQLDKAIATAADLSKHYNARAYMVSVSSAVPSEVAHNPEEFAQKLRDFAAAQSAHQGIEFVADALTSHDPAVDLDTTLSSRCRELDIDLVVMASHVPGFADHLFASNAGYLATHSALSVFVVR